MNIKAVKVGMLETNCYIVSDGDSCIIIDPGDEAENIIEAIGGLNVEAIILTHLHFDHIGAVRELKKVVGAKVFCHKNDLEIIDENLLSKDEIDGFLEDDHIIPLATYCLQLTTIPTPGHTPGSICLYDEKNHILFSGDTIFAGSIGATHFKGGNFTAIKDSIENKLLTLPDDTLVYPGHGESFKLGDEKGRIEKIIN